MFHVAIHRKDATADSSWSAIPSNSLVQRLHSYSIEGSLRWIAVFRSGGEEHRIALGSPDGDDLRLAIPGWFLDSAGLAGDGEEIIVRFERCETMTSARQLRFKAIEPLPDWLDIRDILEEPLSQLGVIKQGQMLPIPVLDSVLILLDSAEPADEFLFLDGDEIAIDIADSHEPVALPMAEPEPVAVAEPEPVPAAENTPLIPTPVTQTPVTQGFVPFSGKGRTLGTGQVVWGTNN